jgi:uncharacterized protein (TIGR02300 family)
MVKAAWGTKRTCQSCGARFYDLNNTPITCPKCHHAHDPEDFVKTRRSRAAAGAAAAAAAKAAAAKGKAKEVVDGVALDGGDLPEVEGDDDTADDAALEDTDDLAEEDASLEVDIEDKGNDEET